jgi:G:T-mismatch repair DNA endonuclease (very short patch repair protein)
MQLKLALQDFGFMVALVTECVLQYSLALSNLLQRPSIDLVEAASEAHFDHHQSLGHLEYQLLMHAQI